jgi:hypothetical protein
MRSLLLAIPLAVLPFLTSHGLDYFYKYIPHRGYLLTLHLKSYCPKNTKLVFLFLSPNGKVFRKSYHCRKNLKRLTVRKLFKKKFQGKVLLFKPSTMEVLELGSIPSEGNQNGTK